MDSQQPFAARPEDQSSLLVELQRDGDTEPPRMVVSGEVDAVSAAQLQKAVVGVLRQHRPSRIDLDFDQVTFLDSAGIRALVLCHADAKQVDCKLMVTRPRHMVYRVLEITGLLEYLCVTGPEPSDGAADKDGRHTSRLGHVGRAN